jgi:hypothetical protein
MAAELADKHPTDLFDRDPDLMAAFGAGGFHWLRHVMIVPVSADGRPGSVGR